MALVKRQPRKELKVPNDEKKIKTDQWYAENRRANERRNNAIFNEDGWFWCDPDSFYRSLFPEGFLQADGDDSDGKPNILVLEDTGEDQEQLSAEQNDDDGGKPNRKKRVMHRYTVHDDLSKLRDLRLAAIEKNSFMFLAPVSYYGKSRVSSNARYLHAVMIDLDYVGDRQLANLFHQMKRKVIPQANYLVSSGTGLHVVYKLKEPVPLLKRYVPGLQILKRELTDLVWNAHTSDSDPAKKQYQGIFQAFRMVGSPTKLNGSAGNPKTKQPYVAECFSHDSTPAVTIPYLLSFIPDFKKMKDIEPLKALRQIGKEARSTVPISKAKEMWPEWYEERIVRKQPRKSWVYGRAAYDRILDVISKDASVSHRYWCLFYLAVMANKCGISYEELEDDAYGLLDRFESLTVEPDNHFTAHDVASALEAYQDGRADCSARRYTKAFLEEKSAVEYGRKLGTKQNPPDQRLSPELTLKKARAIRDVRQEANGTNWWDNGNRSGAPTKRQIIWDYAFEHPDANHSEIAKALGVSRPTVIKWMRELESDFTAAEIEQSDKAMLLDGEVFPQPEDDIEFNDFIVDEVVSTIAENPWKSFDEVAALCWLESASDVQAIVDENPGLLAEAKARADRRFADEMNSQLSISDKYGIEYAMHVWPEEE